MLSPLQMKLLDMFKWFHDFCDANNIKYYAVEGTMLGAVRHQGFIPWDDDIDVAVPREDYERLLSIFNNKIDHYYLEAPTNNNSDYLYTYAKLYDTDTTLVERAKYPCKRGVFIDVFPLDDLGATYRESIKKFKTFDRLNMFLMCRTCLPRAGRRWYKNLSIAFASLIPSKLISEKQLSLKLDKIAASSCENAVYCAVMMSTYRRKEIMKTDIYGTPQLYKFEGIEVYGPEKAVDYLNILYGDWEKLPPEEKRKVVHDFIKIDLEKSYLILDH